MKPIDFIRQAMVAAIYVAACLALAPLSYGPIQFRFAEMLMILPFFDKKYTIGLTVGCLLANLLGPYGLPDIILGTFATFLACFIISRLKQKHLIAAVAAVINGLIIGLMIFVFYNEDGNFSFFAYSFLASTIFIGEFVVVAIGTVLIYIIEKNEYLQKVFK